MILAYLPALLITIAVELAIVATASRLLPSLRGQPILATCVCVNLLTHPLATLAHHSFGVPILPIELSVIAAESLGYWQIARVPLFPAVALSLIANSASLLVGVAFF